MGAIKAKRFTVSVPEPITAADVRTVAASLGIMPKIAMDDAHAPEVGAAPEADKAPPDENTRRPPDEPGGDFSEQQASIGKSIEARSPIEDVALAVLNANSTDEHVCFRCRQAPGAPAYCHFCASAAGANINARVADLLESKPERVPTAPWRRAVFAMLDCFPEGQHASALCRHVDMSYPIVRAIVDAVFSE